MCKRLFLLTSFVFLLSLVCPASGQLGQGSILFEWFDSTSGSDLDEALDGRNVNYPDNPSESAWLPTFQGPTSRGDNYMTRVRGYLSPPADGDYTFWISSDDDSRLSLSTDDDPANATQICMVSPWTDSEQWDKYPDDQMSAPITLLAGQKYYIEVVMREGGGGDNLAVGWGGPTIGDGPVVIDGAYLSALIRDVDFMAIDPNPADGAIDVDTTSLEWTPGKTAVSHKVYLSADDVIDESDLAGETELAVYEITTPLTPGATYYWRVDEIDADGTVFEGNVWSFGMRPLEAHFESPYDGQGNVMLDVQLNWTAGKDAIMHSTYFGTDPDIVTNATGAPMAMDVGFDPAPLEMGTTYYWRVDEFTGPAINAGPVWSFTTIPDVQALIDDPNLVGYWTFDEGMFSAALDVSGNNRHGMLHGDPQWVAGYEGGALEFDGIDDYVNIDGYKGICLDPNDPNSVQPAFSITNWFRIAPGAANGSVEMVTWGTSAGRKRLTWRVHQGRLRTEHAAGNLRGNTYVDDNEWHHGALVVTEGANLRVPATRLYVDGVEDTIFSGSNNPYELTPGSDVRIGMSGPQNGRYWPGSIDDVRIYDKALMPEDFELILRIDMLKAWNPSPANLSANQLADVTVLSWLAGDGTIMHNVYFGTDRDTVANAVGAPMSMDIGFDPGPLELDTTYYWRVDELNDQGQLIKGRVWKFTIEPFLLVDDFESYTDEEPDRIFDVWADGWEIQTNGSMVGYPRPDIVAGEHFVETGTTHGGSLQSMPYFYDNYYKSSAATLTLSYPRDWTEQDVGGLSLWFRGDAANAAEPMYVAIANADSNAVTVYHEDPNATLASGWTEWVINLQKFEGVDLTDVDTITIGFGNDGDPQAGGSGLVLFDDIVLTRVDPFSEDFESYAAGDALHGVGGWAGWGGDAGAGAPVSDAFASSGTNSVEVVGTADLVQEFDIAGGTWTFSAMQYIPSGTTGKTYFILMNQYGATNDWSVQMSLDLAAGTITSDFGGGATANILYDQWVEMKYIIDLDNNTVDEYYNGELISTHEWDDNVSGTLGALDLFGNGASSVYYDDIIISRL